jgi:hypothetical protein
MKKISAHDSRPAQTVKFKHVSPGNKEDLDSRKNEEQNFKGDDITHNKKHTKEKHLHNKDS